MQKEYFTTSLEHILAELERIDLLILLHLTQARQLYQFDDGFQELFIPEQMVYELQPPSFGIHHRATASASLSHNEIRNALDEITGDIWLQKAESKRRGIRLRLDELEALFDLTQLELDIFLLCLAPELDLLYERIYAYLQDDVTKTRPSMDLVSNMQYPGISAKPNAAKYIDAQAPLCRNLLLQLIDDPLHQQAALRGKYLKVDERVVNYLLELEIIDPYLRPHVWRAGDKSGLEGTKLPADLKHRLAFIARDQKIFRQGPVFYFEGPDGMGKQATAQALCKELGLGLLIIDLQSMLRDDRLGFEKALRLVRREALLQHAALYWQGFDLLLAEDKHADLRALLLEPEEQRSLAFLAGKKTRAPAEALNNFPFMRIEFPDPDHTERFKLRTRFLDGNRHTIASTDLVGVANEFRFNGGQIPDATATAGHP
jgi:hypothetical protein